MNRLSPLIKRRQRSTAALAGAGASPHLWERGDGAADAMADDLKLFVSAWFGGLVFFGTYLS